MPLNQESMNDTHAINLFMSKGKMFLSKMNFITLCHNLDVLIFSFNLESDTDRSLPAITPIQPEY